MPRLITLLLLVTEHASGILFKPCLKPRLLRPPCAPRFGRNRCRGRRRFIRPPPSPLPLYFGVMGAPVYGRDILPFLGGLIDFEALEPRSSPNEYLAAPLDAAPLFNDTAKRIVAPTYPVSAEELRTSFEQALAKRQPLNGDFWAKPVQEDSDAFASRFVYVERTPLFRFPDVVNVQFLEVGNGSSTLILHSASVYGQSDLGKNKERVEDLLKRISDLPTNMTATAVSV